jgi:plastocyanin
MHRARQLALLSALLLVVAACGGDDDGVDVGEAATDEAVTEEAAADDAADGASGGTAQGSIVEFAFDLPASVPVGTILTVANGDEAAHTFTSTDGGWDERIEGGARADVPLETAGTFAYVCTIHTQMTGSITVQ